MKNVIVAGDFDWRLNKNDMRGVTFIEALDNLHYLSFSAEIEPTYYSYDGTSFIDVNFCNSAVQTFNSHIKWSDMIKNTQIKVTMALSCSKRSERYRANRRIRMEEFEKEMNALLMSTSESCFSTSTTCFNNPLEELPCAGTRVSKPWFN